MEAGNCKELRLRVRSAADVMAASWTLKSFEDRVGAWGTPPGHTQYLRWNEEVASGTSAVAIQTVREASGWPGNAILNVVGLGQQQKGKKTFQVIAEGARTVLSREDSVVGDSRRTNSFFQGHSSAGDLE